MNSMNKNKKIIIVESPTKARTIRNFLTNEFEIEASYGHVRDLPKSKLGVDVENNFKPTYVIPTKNRKRLNNLKKKVENFQEVILATDEDREGEAIAWHLTEVLNLEEKNTKRIVFHEITKNAITEALKKPRKININLVNAQQTRRILDRLVGYLLSPFLWKKILKGLSAGRVQSVALRLIVERENEIRNFIPQIYFSLLTLLKNDKSQELKAELIQINNKKIEKLDFKNEEEVKKIEKDLEKCIFKVLNIEKKQIKKNPPPPFITSTLQQEAFKKLKYSSKTTMRLAQELYEKGLITYMRTDSTNLSQESLNQLKKWTEENLPSQYQIENFRIFKNKSKLAQEAHEAIRPTDVYLTIQEIKKLEKKLDLNKYSLKLYELIWRRFVSSQLPPALFELTNIEIKAENKKNNYLFKTNGYILKFDGFLKFWPQALKENLLPQLNKDDELKLIKTIIEKHQTEPPPRYNEASLIKILEKYGIGRPSTYAPIISIIQERNYVMKDENKKFRPTEIGELVNNLLITHFPDIVDINFTALMEENLDKIAQGKIDWVEVLKNFYQSFSSNLEKKYKEVLKVDLIKEEETNEKCEICHSPLIIKFGKFGKFLACSKFPECKFTKSIKINNYVLKNNNKIICPKCQQGYLIIKLTKKKRKFFGCENYPHCDYATWKLEEKD